MKKILLATAALGLVSTPAFAADNDSVDVTITGTVAEECSIEDLPTLDVGTIPIVETPGADALQINAVADSGINNLVWVSCNFTNSLTLETPTPLTSASAAALTPMTGSQPFTNVIHYRLRAQNYGLSPSANSLNQTTRVDANKAPLHKEIRFIAEVLPELNTGARPYAATDYTATATISITTI